MLRTITAMKRGHRTVQGAVQPNRLILKYERLQRRLNEFLRHRVIWRGLSQVASGNGGYSVVAVQQRLDSSDASRRVGFERTLASRVLCGNGVHDSRYVSDPLYFSHIEPVLSQRSHIGKYFDKNSTGVCKSRINRSFSRAASEAGWPERT